MLRTVEGRRGSCSKMKRARSSAINAVELRSGQNQKIASEWGHVFMLGRIAHHFGHWRALHAQTLLSEQTLNLWTLCDVSLRWDEHCNCGRQVHQLVHSADVFFVFLVFNFAHWAGM